MIQEELFVDDSPPVCLVQLSNKSQTHESEPTSPKTTSCDVSLSTPENLRGQNSPTASSEPVSDKPSLTIADGDVSCAIELPYTSTEAGIAIPVVQNNSTMPSFQRVSPSPSPVPTSSCTRVENNCVVDADLDEDLDPEDRPLTVDLSKDDEGSENSPGLQTATDNPVTDNRIGTASSTTATTTTTTVVDSATPPASRESPADHFTSAVSSSSVTATEPALSKPNPINATPNSTTHLPLSSSTNVPTPVSSALDISSSLSTLSTSLLDIRPKPTISCSATPPTIVTSAVGTSNVAPQTTTVHLMPYTGPILSNPPPPVPFGTTGAIPLAGSVGGAGPGGLQILNMTPIPQFVGAPGIVLQSAGTPGFQGPTGQLISGLPGTPLGPGPPLNFLQTPHHPTFSTTLLHPTPGMDFLMDPSMGLTHPYGSTNPLGLINPPVLDPLSSMYPSFVQPPSHPTTFLVTSSSVFIPPSYRPSLAGGTNIVNATAPQMSTSAANLFPCSLPNVSAPGGGGPLYLHPSPHTPIIPSSFGPNPTSIYTQPYPPFSMPTLQCPIEPTPSSTAVSSQAKTSDVSSQSSTPVPICPTPSDGLMSKKLPLPSRPTAVSSSFASVRPLASVRHTMLSSTVAGLVPNHTPSSRTVGIRAPNSTTVLPPLRRRRPLNQSKSKAPTSESLINASMDSLVSSVSEPQETENAQNSSVTSQASVEPPMSPRTTIAQSKSLPLLDASISNSSNSRLVTTDDTSVKQAVINNHSNNVQPVCVSPAKSLSSPSKDLFPSTIHPDVTSPQAPLVNGFRENANHSPFPKRTSQHEHRPPSTRNRKTSCTSSSPLEATGLLPVSRSSVVCSSEGLPPPVLLLGPDSHRILTHYVDGHVIYESNKPFPVRNGMSIVEAALLQQCIQEDRTTNGSSSDTNMPLVNGFDENSHSGPTSGKMFLGDVPTENFNPRGSEMFSNSGTKTSEPLRSPSPLFGSKVLCRTDGSGQEDLRFGGSKHSQLSTSPMSADNSLPSATTTPGGVLSVQHQPNAAPCFPPVPQMPLPLPPGPVCSWTSDDVVDFVRGTPGCGAYASAFLANEIDGEALLLLAQDQFIQPPIGMKIGPALKLAARLESIRHVS